VTERELALATAKRNHPATRSVWAPPAGLHPLEVRSVLAVIAAYEGTDQECSSFVIDWETGLAPSVVDDVLDYLWAEDMVECRVTGSPCRHPSVSDVRRVTDDGGRRWGPWGRYRPTHQDPGLLGA
jgi:hypothetical protein